MRKARLFSRQLISLLFNARRCPQGIIPAASNCKAATNSPLDFFALSSASTCKKSKFRPRRSVHALESRIVFCGALATALVDPNHVVVDAATKAIDASKALPVAPVAATPAAPRAEIVFIESNVADYRTLLKDFNSNAEVHVSER